ncbi:hypothetical protein MY10362_003926 [Beauveria mimosiformis]
MGITLVVAPFLGGVLTDKLTWRWCFWINLPLGGLTIFIVLLLVRIPQEPNAPAATGRPTLDNLQLPGVVLLLASTVSLLLALQWGGPKYTWSSWQCILYNAHTSTGYWGSSLILAGRGFGLGAQQCMMIPQTILKGTDIALGTSVVMFAETLSGAVFLAVCESLFETRLVRELHRLAPTANTKVVMQKGAVNLKSSMTELYGPEVAAGVLQFYSGALQPVWIVAVVLGALSLGAVFAEWISINKDSGHT